MDRRPIGIFDSGIGGTSIWKEINTLLPEENTIYLADTKNAPYGERSPQEILELSLKNTRTLIRMDCKLIVVACNTATTVAIDHLRKEFDLPFVGIEPAIKPAAVLSSTGSVGVLATKGTLGSALFGKTSKTHAADTLVIEKEGAGLVHLIESGKLNSYETRALLEEYLRPMLDANIDHLVLGCTHYPYLIPLLEELLPKGVKIIDCGEAVARQTKNMLERHGLLNTTGVATNHLFYSNSDLSVLEYFLKDAKAEVTVSHLDF